MIDQALLNRIQDPQVRAVLEAVANLYEQALTEIDALKAEIVRLRDENNRLKGEHGDPGARRKGATKPKQDDHSSEAERKLPKRHVKSAKNDKLTIDRTVRLPDPTDLPPDAEFKSYESVTVQDVVFHTETIRFERAKFYSAKTHKTYLSPMPDGYSGEFGPNVESLALVLHHLANVSQKAIRTVLTSAGMLISAGQISNMLVKGQDAFHKEREEIGLAGLQSSPWQQTDDTFTSVNGAGHHAHVICNPLYARYHTALRKDRLSVLDVLLNGQPRSFLLTRDVLDCPEVAKLPKKWRKALADWPLGQLWNEAEATTRIDELMPTLSPQNRKTLLEQMALAAYHAQEIVPVIELLVCDDAPQFRGVTAEIGLCWVHDARHYKKLEPHLPLLRETLTEFMTRYWDYYRRLLAYRDGPSASERANLWRDFDELFVPSSSYEHLNFRIQQTAANKPNLLAALDHPEIPLHNNASELAARARVRKRDVSFGPRTPDGAEAWDTFQTIAATAQKLGVSLIAYLKDRISQAYSMPSLASLITERAAELNLGGSWDQASPSY